MLHTYRHIYYMDIYYIYCSLDDNVGIYKMIFIFIKLENDNSNETNARAGLSLSALPCPMLPLAISRLLSRLLLPQADQFPQLQSAASAVSQQLKLCSGIVQITSPCQGAVGTGWGEGQYKRVQGGVPGSSCGCCVGVVLCPVSEQLLNALKFIHRA